MDISRHVDFFDPAKFAGKSVSIIGAGATGSHAALYLSQLGIGNEKEGCGVMKVFDFDIVEPHNLPNQAFFTEHVGLPKVKALQDLVRRKTGFDIRAYNIKVEAQPVVASEYVLLLVDSMEARKQIVMDLLAGNQVTELVIETRMGFEGGLVYAFNPQDQAQVERWLKCWYPDSQAVTSACGTSQSIGITAAGTATLAAATLLQHFDWKHGNNYLKSAFLSEEIPFEVRYNLYPLDVLATK